MIQPPDAAASPDVQAAMTAAGLVPGQSPVPARSPDPATLFTRRAARLRRLADGAGLSDWLSFMATLADAQGELIAAAGNSAIDAPAACWTGFLPGIDRALRSKVPAAAVAGLDALAQADALSLNGLYERIMAGEVSADDLPAVPFAVAALQIPWTRYAATRDKTALSVSAKAAACPVCGAPPVAGVIQAGSSEGLRYLHCGVCHTAWHHVRSACLACGESLGVGYRSIEGRDDGVRAEVCGSCNSYSKLFMLEKAPDLDPIADDLASLALDLLVGEQGFNRFGYNPFLLSASSC